MLEVFSEPSKVSIVLEELNGENSHVFFRTLVKRLMDNDVRCSIDTVRQSLAMVSAARAKTLTNGVPRQDRS